MVLFMKIDFKADICEKRSKSAFLRNFPIFSPSRDFFLNWRGELLPGKGSQNKMSEAKHFQIALVQFNFLILIF